MVEWEKRRKASGHNGDKLAERMILRYRDIQRKKDDREKD